VRSFIVGSVFMCVLLASLSNSSANSFGGPYGVALTNNGYVIGELGAGSPPDTYIWRNGVMTLLPFDEAFAVNERGQVVGYTYEGRGLLWEGGRTIALNAPGDTRFYFPEAINNRGQVAGVIFDDIYLDRTVAFIWDNGAVTELGFCQAIWGGGISLPNSYLHINERGDVIGAITDPFFNLSSPLGPGESFFWRNGVRTNLTFLAADLNNRGQVVGGSFLWEDGTYTYLGSLGGGGTLAQAINERGQVAGTSWTATGERHVFLWENGRMQDLGGISMDNEIYLINVRDLNERGQVVGDQTGNSMLWEAGTAPVVLGVIPQSSGLIFGRHERINERGQILINDGFLNFAATLWNRGDMTRILPPTFAASEGVEFHSSSSQGLTGDRLALEFAGPNPPQGSTKLRFAVPRSGQVTLRVFDVRGRVIRELVSGWTEVGVHHVVWNGLDDAGHRVAPGIYFTRLNTDHESRSLRLIRVQ